MSQRVIKPKINKQIELYRKEATILETSTILNGTISSIDFNPGSYTALTAMTITIADPPTKATPDTATATASLPPLSISSTFTIGTAGTGYNSVPTISFSGGNGSGTAAVAVLTSGALTGITLYNGGSGYTSAPTIVIGPPSVGQQQAIGIVSVLTATTIKVDITNPTSNGYYTSAPAVSFTGTGLTSTTGTAVLTNGRVTSVTIGGTMSGLIIPTSVKTITLGVGGSGYTTDPTVEFTGGGGSGESAVAVLTGDIVSSITYDAFGTGINYTSIPIISFTGGGGTGATATCTIQGSSDLVVTIGVPSSGTQAAATATLAGLPISSVSLTNPGWYYTVAPLVSISGGSGTGAIVTSTIKDGKVISLNLVSGGTGYTSSPTLTLTAAPAGVTALATVTIAGNKITAYTIGTAGSGYKTAPTITIATQTSTPVTAATFQAVLGGINYVKKFSWDIQPLSLDECGIMRVLKRTYSPFVVSSTSSQPYKISVCDIQTNASHRTIAPNGSQYIPKSAVLECEYPFYQVSEPIPLPLAPQNLNRIVLRIDEDMSADIGLKSTTDFLILLHVEEKEPDFIEYGTRNNIQIHQQPALASQNYGGSYYGY